MLCATQNVVPVNDGKCRKHLKDATRQIAWRLARRVVQDLDGDLLVNVKQKLDELAVGSARTDELPPANHKQTQATLYTMPSTPTKFM